MFAFVCHVYVQSAMKGEPLQMAEDQESKKDNWNLKVYDRSEDMPLNYNCDFILEDLLLLDF